MIKNFVFDMGKVLTNYDSMRACRHYLTDPKDQQLVNAAVFVSPEWILLDMGVISDEEALPKMLSRLPDERLKEAARQCMTHWHQHCMWPIPEMGQLVRDLKQAGYGIYLCSNAAIRLLDCYRQVIPAIDCFDGILFSAEVKCIKPQKEMYQHLYDRFSLKPEECFFIDDLPSNIRGAKETGMDGYCFADQDVEKLRKTLTEWFGI